MSRIAIGSLIGGICLILLTALTGNSDAVDPWNIQDNTVLPADVSSASATLGQTFVSHYPRLHSIQVRWIASADFLSSPDAKITLHLRHRIGDSSDIAVSSFKLDEIRNNEFSKFVFPPIEDSQNQSFYFFLNLSQTQIQRGSLSLWSSESDDYPYGQMYMDGLATDRDLVFRSYYEPDVPILLGALKDAFAEYGWGIVVALFLFLGFGLGFIWVDDLLATFSLASGTGLAIISALSILLLFFRMPAALAISAALGAVFLVVIVRRILSARRNSNRRLSFHWGIGVLGILALLSLSVSLVQVRDVPVPLWVDSGSHAESIRVLLDEGRLPASQFYHMGYQTIAALLAQLANLSTPQAMLLMGQLLITQTGLSVFVLTRRLSHSTLAGLIAAICVWFLSPTPSYFVTWGRYPLLLGGALLPIALFSAVEWLDAPRLNARLFAFAVVTFSGLAFAHIRLIVFYLLFLILYTLFSSSSSQRKHQLSRVGLISVVGIIFGIVWLSFLFTRGMNWQAFWIKGVAPISIDISTAIAVVLSHHGPELYLLATLAAITGLVRRSRLTVLVLAWYAGLFAISILPLSGSFISADLVILMSYLPVALSIGDAAHDISVRLKIRDGLKRLALHRIIWATVISIVVLLGARDMVSIVNPATVLFTEADAPAMIWISDNTPTNSKFLVNSFLWTDSVYVPSDGGMWIPYSTGHPIEYLHSSQLMADEEIASRGINFIYLGRRAGVLRRTDFACQPSRYALVYHQDGIDIYRVRGPDELPGALPDACNTRG